MTTANGNKIMDILSSLDEATLLTYVTLMSKCALTLDDVSLRSSRPVEDTKDRMRELVDKGLATAFHQIVPTYCAAQPYRNLADQLELARSREVEIRHLIDGSTARIVDSVNEDVRGLLDLASALDAGLAASLENVVSQNKKEFDKVRTERASSLSEKIKTLRESLDAIVGKASTNFEVHINRMKATNVDAVNDLQQDLAASPSREIIEQSNMRLSGSMEKIRAVPPKMTEGTTRYCEALAKRMTGFKSATTNLLSRFGKTAKRAERLVKTTDTSLEAVLSQVGLALSGAKMSFIEVIGAGPEPTTKKLSVQRAFANAQMDMITSVTTDLGRIALAHTQAVERTQKAVDKLVSDIRGQTQAFFKTNLDLAATDSKIAGQLYERIESLGTEITKTVDATTKEMADAAGDAQKISEFQTSLMAAVQSITDNIRSVTAEAVRSLDEATSLNNIKEQMMKAEDHTRQISSAGAKSDLELSESLAGILRQISQFEDKHNASSSMAAEKLESVAKNLHAINIDVPELSEILVSLSAERRDLGQLKEETKGKISAIGASAAASAVRLLKESLTLSQSVLGRLREEVENLPRRIEASARDSIEAIQKSNAKMKADLEAKQAECGRIKDSVREAGTRMTRSAEKRIKSVQNSFEKMKGETSKAIIAEIKKIETDSDEAIKTMRAYLAENMNMVDSIMKTERTNIEVLPERINETLSKSLSETQETMSASVNEATELANRTIEETKKSISESVSETVNEIGSVVSTISEDLRRLIEESNEITETQKTEFIDEIRNVCANETDRAMSEILEVMNFLGTVLDKKEAALAEKATALAANIGSAVSELANNATLELLNSKEQLKTTSSEAILSNAEEFSGSLTELTSRQAGFARKILAESTMSFSNRVIHPIEGLKASIARQATATASTIAALADEAERITAMNAMTIARIAESINSVAKVPVTERTWHLSSRNAVIEHLKGMIERAKSTVFIQAPASSYLPTAKEFSRRKEVLFHVQVGEIAGSGSTDRAIDVQSESSLASLKALPNIRLNIETRRPYIVVNRDNAEILAGAENESDKRLDASAIVSEEPAYLELVKELVGPSLLIDT